MIIIEPGSIQTGFGDVLLKPMRERSRSTDYSELAKKMEKATIASYEKGAASPPSVIADIIARANETAKPRTRYAAGMPARPLMFVRKWFGDRLFDRAVMRATGVLIICSRC